MTLKETISAFAFLLCGTFIFATPTAKISFIKNNIETAKKKAAQEGKLIMVDFWASWCSPCRWMDEQTFSRPEVSNYLNNNYISVRVDIDNFDGLNYRNQFGIRFLPTILILDAKGNVVKKYEESMAPSKLVKVLKEHDSDKNIRRNMIQSMNRPIPREKEVKPAPVKKYVASTTGKSKTISYSSNTNNERVTRAYSKVNKNINNNHIYKPIEPASSMTNPIRRNYNSVNDEGVSDVGLYQMNVKKAPRTGHSVQVGAYYDYKNVLIEVAKFQKAFAEEVLVHISELRGQPCYKILLGHYTNYGEATKDKNILKEAGIKDAFVKDLSTLGIQ